MLYQDPSRSPRERARDLLSRMTLREKVGQVNQRLYGFAAYTREGEEIRLSPEFQKEVETYGGLGVLYGLYRADPWSQKDFRNGLYGPYMKRAYNLAQKYVLDHSRLGIPMLMSTECPHGHQALDGYLLPVNLGVGAAWNPASPGRPTASAAGSSRSWGWTTPWSPCWTCSGTPGGAAARSATGRTPISAPPWPRRLSPAARRPGCRWWPSTSAPRGRPPGASTPAPPASAPGSCGRSTLPPMKACCEAGVEGVMAAYNEIDGVYCHANRRLLQDVLRGELGFAGAVMADGTAIDGWTT